jgi:hypothetical protein
LNEHMQRKSPTAIAVAAALFALLALAATRDGAASPAVPAAISPPSGAPVSQLPAFAWRRIPGATAYEFQLAPDPRFKTGAGRLITSNTRATLTKTLPNGTYWWRVRALSGAGHVSGWSSARAVRMSWHTAPRLIWPNRARVRFPSVPLTLRWAPVPGAVRYQVTIATDRALGSPIGDARLETAATSFTPDLTPAAGANGKTYYWAVTPFDAEGNRGEPSRVAEFTWEWPSETTARLTDLRPEPETFDPQFSWDAVAGAARYEVDVNSSRDFAPGSRVCCSKPVVGTSLSPTNVFRDNTYYWRVRPLDADGNAGVWSPATSDAARFDKTFDQSATLGRPSIVNLHVRDLSGDLGAGASTQAPVVVWDPVPAASSYLVEMVPYAGFCDWSAPSTSHWRSTTSVTAWTPLGRNLRAPQPFPDRLRPDTDSAYMVPGVSYCVRVRARADRDESSGEVQGDFTYLDGNDRPAFRFGGWPCSSGCARGNLAASDYVTPGAGETVTTTPYFAWRPARGASWFVVVAKDPDFHTIVDYAWTQIPAYAPRDTTQPVTYPDETTTYYWAVLPAAGFNGESAVGSPSDAAPSRFNKQSTPPRPITPTQRQTVADQPTFSWTPVAGARRYHLQVARDDDFGPGTIIDDVTTASIAYTSDTNYPADVALYWRVRAEDELGVGLVWSERRTFRHHLLAPTGLRTSAAGDVIPTIRWRPVRGAVSYDLHVAEPDGGARDFRGMRSAAATWVKLTGTGIFRWKVRANFPTVSGGTVAGPYSSVARFTRTLGRPDGTRTSVGGGVTLSWRPKLGAKSYRVEIARAPDFQQIIESGSTDLTSYAPLLSRTRITGRLFWRVAAADESGNQGAYSRPHSFAFRP